jgi:hypothetical protein
MKKICALSAAVIMTLASMSSVFAGENVNTDVYTKKTAYAENIKGKLEFKNSSDISVENVQAGSVTTKKVTVNNQEINGGEGKVVISNKNNTSYKNVKSGVIVDLDVNINTPIVHGDDVDVEIENSSNTDFDNVEAGKIYKYGYSYNRVVRIP